jgi:hypothetical protein
LDARNYNFGKFSGQGETISGRNGKSNQVTTSGQVPAELTMAQYIGHRGYLSAMQYLEMNPAYKNSFPAVGE